MARRHVNEFQLVIPLGPVLDFLDAAALVLVVARRRRRPVTTLPSGIVVESAETVEMVAVELWLPFPARWNPTVRPLTRGDCAGGYRPCPWVSCRHHLAYDINPHTGELMENYPGRDPLSLEHTCSLDVAEQHQRAGLTLEDVGQHMGIRKTRVYQIEQGALKKLRDRLKGENDGSDEG